MKIKLSPDQITSGSWGAERSYEKVSGESGLEPIPLWGPLRSPNHIRLLLLFPPGWPDHKNSRVPHQDDTDLQCEVFQAPLEALSTTGRPKFAALSYCWGRTEKTRSILCNQTRAKITENLFHALVWIRLPTRPRLIWVDYLCINQIDLAEKSEQVSRMGRIFRQAHVISYIGGSRDTRPAGTCLAVFRRLAAISDLIFLKHNPPGDYEFGDLPPLLYSRNRPLSTPEWHLIPWQQLVELMYEDYFTRLWVFQEIRLARSHTCQWGSHFCSMHQLNEAGRLMWLHSNFAKGSALSWRGFDYLAYIGWTHVQRMSGDRLIFSMDSRDSDLILAEQCTQFGCKDPRDHIYGLASLFTGSKTYAVDYSLSVEKVFVDFVFHLISKRKHGLPVTFFSVSFAHRYAYRNPDEYAGDMEWKWSSRSLPSWCPDFGLGGPKGFQCQKSAFHLNQRNRPEPNTRLPAHLFWISDKVLSIRGVRCTVIAACSTNQRSDKSPTSFLVKSGRLALRLHSERFWDDIYPEFIDALREGEREPVHEGYPSHPFHEMSPSYGYWSILESFAPHWLAKHVPSLLALCDPPVPCDTQRGADTTQAFVKEMEQVVRALVKEPRRCFVTQPTMVPGACFGLGPDGIRVGDEVFVAYGVSEPMVLRRVGIQGHYKYIGNCYLHGLMRGEAPRLGLPVEDVLLV